MEQNTNQHLIRSLLGDIYDFKTKKTLEQDVGSFLAPVKQRYEKLKRPDLYNELSNDIRHQYASAVMTQKYGADIAKGLGDLNEFFDFGGSGKEDTLIDKRNNGIGINYGLQYPNYSKEQMLQKIYDDYFK